MPDFNYHASQKDGHMVHGTLSAQDQSHLVEQLDAQGLFLVSWNVVVPETRAAIPLADAPVETASSGTRFDDRIDAQTPLTRQQKMLLCSILAAGIFIGLFRTYQHRHPKENTGLLNEKLSQLHPGMTRSDIESILTERYPGAPKVDKSRYFVPPEFVVEITYDRSGGPDNAQNHPSLNVPMKVFRTSELKHTS